MNIAELRKDARHLAQMARIETDPTRRQELAARAFELAQRAEIVANFTENPELFRLRISGYKSALMRGDISDGQRRLLREIIADAEAVLSASVQEKGSDPMLRLTSQSPAVWGCPEH